MGDDSKMQFERLMREKESERNGDHIVHGHTPESRRFAENDGETGSLKLPLKRKDAQESERMPRTEWGEEPDKHVSSRRT